MPSQFSEEDINRVGEQLRDVNKSLPERFRALFTLRNIGGPSAIEQIARCFNIDSDGELLRHELAYCLGQLSDPNAVPYLKGVLANREEYSMVRHEAAEALGAIGDASALSVLQEFANDEAVEVRETVEIALDRIRYMDTEKGEKNAKQQTDKAVKATENDSPFESVDPALPLAMGQTPSVDEIDKVKLILLDEHKRLFERYRAMFTLRDIAARTRCQRTREECVSALCASLSCRKSALFRHEVAFVLGQLAPELPLPQSSQAENAADAPKQADSASGQAQKQGEAQVTDWVVEALVERIRDTNEHCIVRHEAIEALGEIPLDECRRLIHSFASDPQRVVRESAIVALDVLDAHDSFQYCDTLIKLREEQASV